MKIKTSLLTVLILLAACSNVTVTSQVTVTSTSTPPPPTATDIPTVTATPVMKKLDDTCWELKSLIETKPEISGGLLYYDINSKQNALFDLDNYKTKAVKGFNDILEISPDGSMIASMDNKKNALRLDFQDHYKTYPIPDHVYFGGFLSRDQIWLRSWRSELDNYIAGKGSSDEYFLLSLSTGGITSYSVQLPHFWTNIPAITRIESYLTYSPNLNYAVYSSETTNRGNNTLLNLNTSEVIWNGGSPYDPMSAPQPVWKPDGSAVTIDSHDDKDNYNFHNIDIAGRDIQLTHLDQLFAKPYFPSTPFWSHDGRYLAFIVSSNSSSYLSLLIFDSQSNTLINPCISENTNENLDRWIHLFWSPIGDQIALTFGGKSNLVNRDVVQEVPPDTLIVDLDNHEIYKLPTGINLSGWLSWEIP